MQTKMLDFICVIWIAKKPKTIYNSGKKRFFIFELSRPDWCVFSFVGLRNYVLLIEDIMVFKVKSF